MEKISNFAFDGTDAPVEFVETIQVKEGVECDTYAIVGDSSKDLAIVRVLKGCSTPLQRVLKGDLTLEGFVGGKGKLTVQSDDGGAVVHVFNGEVKAKSVEVKIGQLMQWQAAPDADLVFYEICQPPYEDGRFEDLA